MKRTFRNAATVAGLIERNLPGLRKTGRQATFSSDILYDTLRKYDPDHLMLRITRDEAGRGLVDFGRIEEMLARSRGRIDVVRAPHVTPLAAPLLLEVGRVPIRGRAEARLVSEAAAALLAEAGLALTQPPERPTTRADSRSSRGQSRDPRRSAELPPKHRSAPHRGARVRPRRLHGRRADHPIEKEPKP